MGDHRQLRMVPCRCHAGLNVPSILDNLDIPADHHANDLIARPRASFAAAPVLDENPCIAFNAVRASSVF